MGLTNFPHGISSYGVPILPSAYNAVAGNVYFVGGTAGLSWAAGVDSPECGSKEKPFKTIDYAIGRCTASNGDVIYVLPGHTETVAAAGGITCDISGISIIGLGNGTLRPQITLSATASTIAISAANVLIKDIDIVPGIADIVSVFYITGAYCTLDGLRSTTNSTYSIKSMVLTTAAADNLTIQNCHFVQTVAPGAASVFINLVGCDSGRILNNFLRVTLYNGATSATIGGGTTACTNMEICGNLIMQTGGTTQVSAVLMYTASTGIISDNRIFAAVSALAGVNDPANLYCAENYIEKVVAKSGVLDPVITSDLRLKTGVVYL